jgi:lipoprotein-releasing system permease protein
MSFEWFIARRYLVARRRQAFLSLISLVSVLGVCVGVTALLVALALMTGVQSELRDRIVGATAHLQVYRLTGLMDDQEVERFSHMPGVKGAAPAILGIGLMRSSAQDASFVSIKGIDPQRESTVTEIATAMRSGSLSALVDDPRQGSPGVVLGAGLAQKLRVNVDDEVQVITENAMMQTPFGLRPRPPRVLRVVGTFELGFYEFDSMYAMVTLKTAEQLAAKSGPDYVQLQTANLDDAPKLREELQEKLGDTYMVQDWTQLNKQLYSALALEKIAISLTIGLIVMVAALNIVASLVLLVMEKSPDIAILRTMGAPAAAIRRIFMYQGLTIGLIGTISGTMLGLLVCYVADRYQLVRLDPDVYQISHLPFRVLPLDVLVVVVSAVAVCYVATLYPSRKAGGLDPAEALRNL